MGLHFLKFHLNFGAQSIDSLRNRGLLLLIGMNTFLGLIWNNTQISQNNAFSKSRTLQVNKGTKPKSQKKERRIRRKSNSTGRRFFFCTGTRNSITRLQEGFLCMIWNNTQTLQIRPWSQKKKGNDKKHHTEERKILILGDYIPWSMATSAISNRFSWPWSEEREKRKYHVNPSIYQEKKLD